MNIACIILLSIGALSIVAGACLARKRVMKRAKAQHGNRIVWRMEQNWRNN